jgi:Tol biopolymer transport system component/tRNA A-37 threonylcarbamoyl transferase component Bud32
MQIMKPGEFVAERFRIVRFLAEGGMGEVYEAEDQVLGELVALKFLSRRSMGQETVVRRFRQEIQLARKVTHPNVCRTFDMFQHHPGNGEKPVSFVTMELLRGETLEERLMLQGPMSEEEALPLVRQMADALTAAHTAGVIHRDFKTNNVMLVPTGAENGLRAVVTDFGLARPVEHTEDLPKDPNRPGTRTPITGENQLIGTADYMAPEQLLGHVVTPLSDMYAFGVVLFEMVTGEKPYRSGNLAKLLASRVRDPPTSPRQFKPNLDEVWEQVILSCLERDPKLRPANGWEVIIALVGEEVALRGSQSSTNIQRPSLNLLLAEEAVPPQATRGNRRPLLAILTALLLAGALWFSLSRPPIPHLWSGTPTRLTSAGGLELDPAFSPDGRFLAYSSDGTGHFELWLQDLETSQNHQLTDAGEELFEPTFSPSGGALAYHSKGRGGIWILSLNGGGSTQGKPRQLSSFGSRPAFSPDGKSIVFQSEGSPQLSDTAAPALGPSTLWRVDLGNKKSQQLTKAGLPEGGHAAPTFSPDGQRLVFSTSLYGRSEIWSLDLKNGDTFPIVREPTGSYDPVVAPDGRSLYFSAVSRQVYGLWRVSISKKSGHPIDKPVQIRNIGLASIRQLALSADGRRIAYTAMQTSSELWSMPLDTLTGYPTSQAQPLTTLGGRNNRPAFSSDGERIAFDHWQIGFSIDLWVVAARGGAPQRVTRREGDDTQAQWLSANRLAFRAEDPVHRGLWAVDVMPNSETPLGSPQRILPLPDGVFWATLSPAAPRVAYHKANENGGRTIWVQELLGAAKQSIISSQDVPGFSPGEHAIGFPVWSQDGAWLAYQHRQSETRTHVAILPATGGEPLQITHGESENWPYSFSPDGDKVAFAARRDGKWSLWWVSRSSQEERRLTPSPKLNQYVRYPTWSPHGDQLVYELASSVGDIFLVEATDP